MNSGLRTTRRLVAALVAAFAIIGGGTAYALTVDPPIPIAGESATYTAGPGLNCGSLLTTCSWTFDGVADGTGGQVTHTFPTGGSKTVMVTATGDTAPPPPDDVETAIVEVNSARPSITSLSGPGTVQLGSPATFAATADEPASFTWTVDGDAFGGSGPTIAPTLAAGPHTISVAATDSLGASSGENSIPVFVNRPPVARFTVSPTSPIAGQTVRFTSTSTDPDGGPITSAIWDLDSDGAFDDASGTSASRAYATSGSRTIRLLVTDANGGSGTAFSSLDVAPKQRKSGPKLLSPFPRVRYAGRLTPRGVTITLFFVRVPKGSKIKATCARRCPSKGLKKTARATGDMRLRQLLGTYRPGAVLRISITKKDRIGKYTRISIAKNRAPRRSDKCLWPSSKKPRKCP